MKEKPDAAKLRAFVAKCRNADGGYGVMPGQKSTGSGTYFAAIILHWLDEK
ncbi:MAG: prenyltransferase/squalene oxidase repeat-containing protein [Syntrophobacteraceae bacterium]